MTFFILIFIFLLGINCAFAADNGSDAGLIPNENLDSYNVGIIHENPNSGLNDNSGIIANEEHKIDINDNVKASDYKAKNEVDLNAGADENSSSSSLDMVDQSSQLNDTVAMAEEINGTQLNIQGPRTTNETEIVIHPPKIGTIDLNSTLLKAYIDSYDPSKESSTPGTFDNLQVEINNAPTGPTLHLYRDYKGHYGSRIQFNKGLTIDGHGHTLDCLSEGGCSAFYSNKGNIILKNLRIINGHNDNTDKGGAIYITGCAKYTLINCTFLSNWADDYGGAIYNTVNLPLTIINCTFKNCEADDDGGAIWSEGVVNIEGSSFESNTADVKGGAIYCKRDVHIYNSTLKSNNAKGAKISQCYGGAVYSETNVYVDNSTFMNNYAADYAGAISARTVMINCERKRNNAISTFFINNTANDNDGGALYVEGSLTANDACFRGNHAIVDGGAVFASDNVNLDNCLFESNQAKGAKASQCYGGAIRSKETVTLVNSTFNKNTAADYGGAIYAKTVKVLSKGNDSIFCNYFIDNTAEDNDGGALYVEGSLTANDACFRGNHAIVDGGAVFASDNVNLDNCLFESNQAKGAKASQCYGGAIRSKETVTLVNSTFNKNTAADYGGAIYAKSINALSKGNDSIFCNYFINNTAEDNAGGAIDVESNSKLENTLFEGNTAKNIGGAIQCIGNLTISHIGLSNNHNIADRLMTYQLMLLARCF